MIVAERGQKELTVDQSVCQDNGSMRLNFASQVDLSLSEIDWN